jgi:hypothetical protein
MAESLGYFLMSFTSLKMMALVAAGTFAGIYIGAIPGLSVWPSQFSSRSSFRGISTMLSASWGASIVAACTAVRGRPCC